jgi:hypothetical protein
MCLASTATPHGSRAPVMKLLLTPVPVVVGTSDRVAVTGGPVDERLGAGGEDHGDDEERGEEQDGAARESATASRCLECSLPCYHRARGYTVRSTARGA